MTGIVGVTDAINARLAVVLAGLTIAVPTFRFGQDQLRVQDAPPRVVWVPKRGPVDAKILKAPDQPANWGQPATPANPRPLWRRQLGFEAHVWAVRPNHRADPDTKNDFTAAEQLGQHLVAAVHDVMWGSYAVTSEDWGTTQGSAQRHGAVLVMGIELWMAWSREDDTYAPVTALPIAVGGHV